MTDTVIDIDSAESRPVSEYAEKAYLDYSMYVILDRALPQNPYDLYSQGADGKEGGEGPDSDILSWEL